MKLIPALVLTAGLAAPVMAQCVSNGPDVIVGALLRDNYFSPDDAGPAANYAAAGGIDAFSVGTYSCNIGNVWLNWIDSTNQHPVIGQNLYKYRTVAGSGRFEQIGQSWLKHGFFALSDVLCCPSCQATSGSHLGVGCADPYSATRNGFQSNLGPKFQVNAWTGAFLYPPANPAWSGTTARRLQAKVSELEASSASVRYFVEGQYVSPDDAAAGNQNNNASYREATMTGTTDFAMSLIGTTTRMLPAIRAWKVIDPAVTETTFQIPSEGRIVVSSRATSLGGGQWHYEYAVYNMNSDRCVGSFTVPVHASTAVTNIGFHDVDYLNGDGQGNVNVSGTDWTGVRVGDTIVWAAPTFASTPNGNAIRWGTLYNFRFDADIAPNLGGQATIGTWKVAGSYGVAAQVPSFPASCYANCDNSTAAPILNVNDFTCFLNKYAAGDTTANCDNSTVVPVLNINDFTCFLNLYAVGCT
ncbi:MAG: hypothetical protein JNM80_08975 [Phycisphaerae bacterium]|nr:hypothetical protein [Phycisphaerae bacterium]